MASGSAGKSGTGSEPEKPGPERPKPSGKKAKKLSQKEQSERFKAAALDLEADQSGESFERALDVLVPAKKAAS